MDAGRAAPPPRRREQIRSFPKSLTDWEKAPLPILVVEASSEYTRRRDHVEKRHFYIDAEIADYWIVDPEARSIRVVKPGRDDELTTRQFVSSPVGAREPLPIALGEIFGN